MGNVFPITHELQSNSNSLREIKVTIGDNIKAPEEVRNTTLGYIIDKIQSNTELKRAVEYLRSLPTKEEQNLEKVKLQYFVASILNGYRKKESFKSTEILVFDLDKLELDEMHSIRQQLEAWKYSSVVFTSPSGKGIKLIVRVNRPIYSIDIYYRVYKEISAVINAEFKVSLDTKTCDPARACFLSSDNLIYVNDNAEMFKYDDESSKSELTHQGKREQLLTSMNGVSEGERHDAMLKQIGILINKGMDKDFIRSMAYGFNQLNTPPFTDDEFTKEFESIYNSYNKTKRYPLNFYRINKTDKETKISIDSGKLLDFLADNGFGKFILSGNNVTIVRIEDHIIKLVSDSDIKDFLCDYIDRSEDEYKGRVKDLLIKGNKTFFAEGALNFLPPVNPKILKGSKYKSYLFFQNLYLEITPYEIYARDYSVLIDELVWEDSIIKKELDVNCFLHDTTISEYSRLLFNVCRQDEDWYKALTCAIGYMAHDFKDKAVAKAIIFCDEEIPSSDDSNGGTGKSLISEALRYIRKTSIIDGKNFKADSSFIFQNIKLNTEVVLIDDVRKTFDFESLLSCITSDLTIEQKHKAPFTIPFKDSPKFLITTNYTIKGNGNSFDRRKHELELSNYYNKKHTPIDDFEHRLFDEWTNTEWTRFYKTVAEYIKSYLLQGLVGYEAKNLRTRRLIDSTNPDFLDFVENSIQIGFEYKKKQLLTEFQKVYPEYDKLTSRTFSKWLTSYSKIYDLKMDIRKSNADRYIIFRAEMEPETAAASIETNEINDIKSDLN